MCPDNLNIPPSSEQLPMPLTTNIYVTVNLTLCTKVLANTQPLIHYTFVQAYKFQQRSLLTLFSYRTIIKVFGLELTSICLMSQLL